MTDRRLPYRRLVSWKDWEIPVPDGEAVKGALAFLGISSLLHLALVGLCWFIRQ
jgi:hypothetical protein